MTYNQLKLPWMIAHRIEWLVVYEIAIARAEPKLAPYFALPRERPFICFVLGGGAPQQPIDDARFSARRGRTNAFAVENGQHAMRSCSARAAGSQHPVYTGRYDQRLQGVRGRRILRALVARALR